MGNFKGFGASAPFKVLMLDVDENAFEKLREIFQDPASFNEVRIYAGVFVVAEVEVLPPRTEKCLSIEGYFSFDDSSVLAGEVGDKHKQRWLTIAETLGAKTMFMMSFHLHEQYTL